MALSDAIRHRAKADLLDAADRLRGRRNPLQPPRRLITGDYSNYGQLGEEFKELFIRLGGLQPHHAVLDIGCGPGRMAVPLTGWLTGTYEGFDIVGHEVTWCRDHVTPRYPNFRFQRPDVLNARYNPTGTIPASEFRFPYPDGTFDFAFATSVFTHMLAPDVERYLGEIARTLKPGGTALMTWFLLTDAVTLPTARFTFDIPNGPSFSNDPDSPEAAVAYPDRWALDALFRSRLKVESVWPGGWCGTPNPQTWQDVIVAHAAEPNPGTTPRP
jgi:SAM-dependent methyltransferase